MSDNLSVGQLALGVAGAAAGAFLGGGALLPILQGAALGFSVGGIIDPPDGPNVVTPAGDVNLTVSTYGRPLPRVDGYERIGGNVIWLEKFAVSVEEAVGGKGGGGSSVTRTTHYAHVAIGLAEASIDAVTRIWADNTLIYDNRASNPGNNIKTDFTSITLYSGSETQQPDPLIQSFVGVDDTPAYRGLAYVVLEGLNLSKFGARVPNLQFEVLAGGATLTKSFREITTAPITGVKSVLRPDLGELWRIGGTTLEVYDYVNDVFRVNTDMTGDAEFEAEGITGTAGQAEFAISRDGDFIWGLENDSENQLKLYRIAVAAGGGATLDAEIGTPSPYRIDSLLRLFDRPQEIDDVPFPGYGNGDPVGSFSHLTYQGTGTPPATTTRFLLTVAATSPLGGGTFQLVEPDQMWGLGSFTPNAGGARDAAWRNLQEFYVLAIDGGTTYIETWRIVNNDNPPDDLVTTAERQSIQDISSLFPNSSTDNTPALTYIEDQDKLVVARGRDIVVTSPGVWTAEYVFDVGAGNEVLTSRPFADGPPNGSGSWAFPVTVIVGAQPQFFAEIDVDTWEFTLWDAHDWIAGHDPVEQWYLPDIDAFIGWDNTDTEDLRILYRDRYDTSAKFITLDTVVQRYCLDAGLTAGQIDVTDLASRSIWGFLVSQQGPARRAIERLGAVYNFGAYEADGKVVFQFRDGSSVQTLTQDELGADGEQPLSEQFAEEAELPQRVTLSFRDKNADYLESTQHASLPVEYTSSTAQQHHAFGSVLDVDEGKQAANRLLGEAHVAERTFRWASSYRQLARTPLDVVTVNNEGVSHIMRIERMELTPEMTLVVEATAHDAQVLVSELQGSAGNQLVSVLNFSPETELFVFDVAPLSSLDDNFGLYFAVAPYSDEGDWDGAVISSSGDNLAFSPIIGANNAVPWGHAVNVLGDHPRHTVIDRVNTLTVQMVYGESELASVTELQARNGLNAFAVETDSSWEIIFAATVTDNLDGTVTLSNLVRGRRATETLTGSHSVGNRVVLLKLGAIYRREQPTSLVDTTRYYNVRGANDTDPPTESDAVVNTGRSLDPFPVTPPKGRWKSGGGGVEFLFRPRSRLGIGLEFSTIPPVAESVEKYEIDILDGPGGNVLRTITHTDPTFDTASLVVVEYTDTEMTTDGFTLSTVTEIDVEIYQIGDDFGRGLVHAEAVRVGPRNNV